MTAYTTPNKEEIRTTPKLIKAATIIALMPLVLLILLLIPVLAIINGILDHLTDEKSQEL